MKEVFTDGDYTRVGLYESMLKAAGIPCYVQNAASQFFVASMPTPLFFPTLCILNDDDLRRARELLADLQNRTPAGEVPPAEWVCPVCGEPVPGEFDSCWKCRAMNPAATLEADATPGEPSELAALDKRFLWHPFTPMSAWCADEHEPLVLTHGLGCLLYDERGRCYLDGNSSIWTNIHGHRHPHITAAIKAQLDRLEHASFLGYTHPTAIRLASELAGLFPEGIFNKVFYSDNGSTAVESALRMALQYWQQNGRPERDLILAFDAAYHGDTLGAASLGGIALFKGSANQFGYAVKRIASAAELDTLSAEDRRRIAAIIIEPLIQGAAGMRVWPKGMLQQIAEWRSRQDTFLILDEVMTGFGRTGTMFACQQEQVIPDFLCCAKGLTGGYLPLAATITTQRIFDGFLGESSEGRTFYYGHSYTANPLGCAAALASLEVFRQEKVLDGLPGKISHFTTLLKSLEDMDHVMEVRRCGLIAGIELALSKATRAEYPATEGMGAKVCLQARRHGLLTRPIGNTIVLMPPLCITEDELGRMVEAVRKAVVEICGG